jgi:hypothetical protein
MRSSRCDELCPRSRRRAVSFSNCAISRDRFCREAEKPTLLAIAHSPQFEQDEIDVEFGFVLDGVPHDAWTRHAALLAVRSNPWSGWRPAFALACPKTPTS